MGKAKHSSEIHKEWVDAIINERVQELNQWETQFIDDMYDKLGRGYTLNDNQENKLESIYARVTN